MDETLGDSDLPCVGAQLAEGLGGEARSAQGPLQAAHRKCSWVAWSDSVSLHLEKGGIERKEGGVLEIIYRPDTGRPHQPL